MSDANLTSLGLEDNYIGDAGYYKQMLKTYRGTRLMADGIRAMKDDLRLMAEPESPSDFCRALFQIEHGAFHSYGLGAHSCGVLSAMLVATGCLIVFTALDPEKVNCFFLAELMPVGFLQTSFFTATAWIFMLAECSATRRQVPGVA